MKKDNKGLWLIRLLSFFFAILLFYNANSISLNNDDNGFTELSATAERVPVNVTYNQDKYFISGFDQTVNVDLKSSNKILLDKESNSETRSFSVVMDLTKYGEGTHEVPLQLTGLPTAIKGTIKPSKLTVTIEKKKSNKFPVEPAIDNKIFTSGYELEKATVDPASVTISGGEDSIKHVSKVIAGISDKTDVSTDFSQKVKVYAVDEKGEALNVNIEPHTVRVDVNVTAPTKEVKVVPVQSGVIPKGIKDYSFSLEQSKVHITGPKDILDEINSIDLKIDTTNIRETLSSSYVVVVPKEVKVSPETVFVTVTPNKETSDSSTTKREKSTTSKDSDKISDSSKK
ncbi:YbbR-like domain-containing protein [Vagococcus carniphilus]|uniref:CdaR family protein n=1 Tax=Vagococcus carniphilus TaxID=218144 RepID=UPI003BAC8D7F